MFNNPFTLLKLAAIPAVLAASGYFWFLSNAEVIREMYAWTIVPTDREMEVILHQAGLTPEVLAAAGCSSAQAAEVVDDARDYVINNNSWLSMKNAADDIATAKQQVSQLRRLVRSGQADQDQLAALSTAMSNLATAESTRDGILGDIYAAAVADLSTELKADVATLVGNTHWNLPMEFHAVNRSEPDWVALRNALAAERIAVKRGESVDSEVATLLAAARNETDCAAAKSNLDGNLDAVSTAYAQAIDTE